MSDDAVDYRLTPVRDLDWKAVAGPGSSPLQKKGGGANIQKSQSKEETKASLDKGIPPQQSGPSEPIDDVVPQFITDDRIQKSPRTPARNTASLPSNLHDSLSPKPKYAMNTPFAAAHKLRSIEEKDANSQYVRHAQLALRATVGTMPIDLFLKDERLCPPMPSNPLPYVDPKMFDCLPEKPSEDQIQEIVVSRILLSRAPFVLNGRYFYSPRR